VNSKEPAPASDQHQACESFGDLTTRPFIYWALQVVYFDISQLSYEISQFQIFCRGAAL